MASARTADGQNARIAELAAGHGLGKEAAAKLEALSSLLVADPLAPTALRDPSKIVDDHLADSLVALELEEVRSALQIADLGAGAGLPGLPLAVALPDATVVLVESAAKKCAFLERAVARCELTNTLVVNERAESWAGGRGRMNLVTARALAPLDVVAEYAAPLLRVGGALVAWRGRRDAGTERAAARAAEQLGMEIGEIRRVQPYPGAENRYLHLVLKVTDTPPRFPRRPGVALKRPLGSR